MEQHYIGNFNVSSGILVVSDPCYDRDVWCMGTIENVLNGEWQAFVNRSDKTAGWGTRNFALIVQHRDFTYKQVTSITEAPFSVGVDSGQAGFWDDRAFKGGEDDWGDDGWYDLACTMTLATEHSAGIMPGGAVSSSGYGDGGYICHIYKNSDGKIIRAEIIFIEEEEK